MRISGINIPNDKKIVYSLAYIYGIGQTTARAIAKKAGISEDTRVKDLTPAQEDKLRLGREVMSNIKRLKDVKCFRGIRHMRHLPVRCQRTKTNSRTVRGNVRKTAVSGKKPAAQKT